MVAWYIELTDEGLGIYPIWKNVFYFCPPWMGWPQYSDQNSQ